MESVKALLKIWLVKCRHLINKKLSQQTLFFVHIPKTAGTSFRKSLEERYETLSDYGDNNAHNHPVINRFIYTEQNPFALLTYLRGRNVWIAGHMWIDKYISFTQPHDIVTFVRHPVARTLSHYNHEVRWGENVKDLDTFTELHKAQNTQARYLNALPVRLIGFVGVTERYNDSIRLINAQYDIKIEAKAENANDKKRVTHENLSKAMEEKIEHLNKKDDALYREAMSILDERIRFAESNTAWTWMYATFNHKGEVQGIAYRAKDNTPVPLRISHKDTTLHECDAAKLTPLFPNVRFPRQRFVGFSLKVPIHFLEQGDTKVTCRDTGQQIAITDAS